VGDAEAEAYDDVGESGGLEGGDKLDHESGVLASLRCCELGSSGEFDMRDVLYC
jgi:hypothetical protein